MDRYDYNCFGYFKNGNLTFLHRTGDKDYIPEEFINSDLFKLIDNGNLLEFPVSFGFEIRINEDGLLWAIFYLIGQEHTFFDSSQLNIPNSVGSIEFTIDDEETWIKWVEVKDNYRGKGIAKYLLLLSLNYGKKMSPSMNKVTLDDSSENSAAGTMTDEERSNVLQKNIYHKLGFQYIDIEDGPEMEGDVDVISANEKIFIESKRKRKVDFDEMDQPQSKKRKRRGGGRSRTKKKRKKRTKKKVKRKKKKSKRSKRSKRK